MTIKVSFFSRKIAVQYAAAIAVLSAVASFYFIAVEIPKDQRWTYAFVATISLVLIYVLIWIMANLKQSAKLTINSSSLVVKSGDIFQQNGLKAIGLNEYFDTQVDDKLISKSSLHGQYILKKSKSQLRSLDRGIENDTHLEDSIVETSQNRRVGKKIKYKLGSVFVDGEYLLTAFSHFDDDNRAYLTLKDYIACMISFWDEVDRVYAGRSVSIPLMGSGITRIKDADVQPQELLKVLIWTFKISRVKFKHPANATIVIHKSLVDKINFYDLS